ncbi:MAG: hypothetical protein Q9M35_02590 [Rhodothermus sp.]|nr:hypothetical protein [Rhodothermus sp.]
MPIGLLYLDDLHLADLLLVQRLARVLKQLPVPLLLVHGSGGRAEQLLEAEGYIPERQHGVLVARNDRERALIERGIRETNQRLVAGLNELLIPAVGIQGSDRGLLKRSGNGRLQVRQVVWLEQLLRQGVWPVLSTLVDSGGPPVEAAAAEILIALAQAWPPGTIQVLLLCKAPGEVAAPEVAAACRHAGLNPWTGRLEDLPSTLQTDIFTSIRGFPA